MPLCLARYDAGGQPSPACESGIASGVGVAPVTARLVSTCRYRVRATQTRLRKREGSTRPINTSVDERPIRVSAVFFEAAAKLKAGERSRPVRTTFGFHLLEAVADPGERVPSFVAARGALAAEARAEAERALSEELERDIPVRLHEERIARTQTTGESR